MIKFSNCVKKSSFLVHRMSYNLIRQFLNVAFNEILCKLVLLISMEQQLSILLLVADGYFGLSVG